MLPSWLRPWCFTSKHGFQGVLRSLCTPCRLTKHIFNPTFAFLTSLLYLLPPTASPSAPYTEPIYSLLTFSGIYLLSIKRQMVLAGLCFAGATTIRSTGIFNSITLMCFAVFGDAHIFDLDPKDYCKVRGVLLSFGAIFTDSY